jgi:uncharacterized membrane protein
MSSTNELGRGGLGRLAEHRVAVGAAAGVVGLAAAVAAGGSWSVVVLAAWDGIALSYLALVWPTVGSSDAPATARLAGAEEGSRTAAEAVVLGAGSASLIAVAFTLAEAGRDHGGTRTALILLAVASVALAWACIHTVYTLRYARLYFTQPVGGIGFPGDDPPQYLDFAYVAFTIGMTYQVSDTNITKTAIRRALTHHAVLAYVFGAVILAVAVSSVASLLGA